MRDRFEVEIPWKIVVLEVRGAAWALGPAPSGVMGKFSQRTLQKPVRVITMKSGKEKPVTMDHVVFEVKDVLATVDFYEKVLQFPPVRMKEFLAGDAPFPSARVNGQTLVDFFPREFWDNRRRQQNPNHVCFTMSQSEVAALKRRLSRNKVPIIRRLPRSYGAEGWGNSIYFQDPDGVTLEARFYGKDAKKELSASAQKAQGKAALAMIKASKPAEKPAAKKKSPKT